MAILGLIGAVVSIAVAVWNVYIKVVERKEDKIAKRPYLVADSVQITPAFQEGTNMVDIYNVLKALPDLPGEREVATIKVSMHNNGPRPASGVTARIEMRCADDPAISYVPEITLDSANVLPGGIALAVEQIWRPPMTLGKQWIRVALDCDDAIFGDTCEPTRYYYAWPGVVNEEVSREVVALSAADRDRFEAYLADPSRVSLTKTDLPSLP